MSTRTMLDATEKTLPTISYREGYKYQLEEDTAVPVPVGFPHISSSFFGTGSVGGRTVLVIRKGYAWDGMTGALDTEGSMFASLVHDVFCQATDEGLLPYSWRAEGDRLFEVLLEANMAAIPGAGKARRWWAGVRARYASAAVRRFSKRNEARRKPKPVKIAPAVGAVS